MRQWNLAAVAALLFVGACADSTAPTPRVDAPVVVQEAPAKGTYDATSITVCPVISEADLRALVALALRGGPFNGRIGLGMFDAAAGLKRRGNIGVARVVVWQLAAFIYRNRSEALPSATMTRLINGLLCWVGLPPRIPQNSDSFFILPSDTAQVIRRTDGNAGVLLPPNPVGEPTILAIDYADTIRLNTKYDQYPGGVNITLSSPLIGQALVAVCPSPLLTDPVVRARLRLGHQASFGFEILPPADPTPIGLNCTVPTAKAPSSLVERMVASVARAVLPTVLHAKMQEAEFGGGVGGSASEFSPFAPIDPELQLGGGVGGSASEFLRAGNLVEGPCTEVSGAIGSPLRTECRPQVTITTRNGTPFIGVPVQYTVQNGGGSVGIEGNAASCGPLGVTAVGGTNTLGISRACWTLGLTPGANGMSISASIGGDAQPGTLFSPSSLSFLATGNPAAQFGLRALPATIVAGVPFDVEVEVQDYLGNLVVPATGTARFSLKTDYPEVRLQSSVRAAGPNGGRGAAVSTIDDNRNVTIVNGVATLKDYVLQRTGRPHSFLVSGEGFPSVQTPWFMLVPGAAADLTADPAPGSFFYQNGTLAAGAILKDANQNNIAGATLVFTPLTPGTSINGASSATAVTGANGHAGITGWQLVSGTNSMRISVQSNPSLNVTVTVAGVEP